MTKINNYFWARIGVMILTLFVVVFLIWKLNRIPPPATTMVLCPTRVSSITTADGGGIVQEGMRWYRRMGGGNLAELDPVAVEKWFGANCRIKIDPIDEIAAEAVVFVAAFVTGEPETLYKAGEGIFRWNNQTFKSAHLEKALQSLTDLPIYLRPSRR